MENPKSENPMMRVSLLDAAGSVRLAECPIPVPGHGEVLVRVAAVGICGSDTHYFEHGRIGPFIVEEPLVLGHEASGRIVAVGAGVSDHRIGERISIEPQAPCRRCRQCKSGQYNLCPEMAFFATPPVDGAFAEYVVIGEDFAHTVPESISDAAAALIEPLSVGIWACQKGEVQAGSRVLVTGAGPIGVIAAQVARAFGASEVHITDVSAERLDVALLHGATHAHHAGDRLEGLDVDVFIDAAGAEAAIRSGISAVRPAGTVVLVGLGSDDVSIPVGLIRNREIKMTGVFRYANTWPLAIRLLAEDRIDLDSLVTDSFGLEDVEKALLSSRGAGKMKTIVLPGQ
ncbi:NAD(P)-dependent alcohol dehydrogenase [Arthrobacter sp. UCD-GKA]|uniref:NAD(P)-dependent alcohol dehydrogenase n=1 Tax=Arthrobacter sp. UCD-GKA TaxID=1913576 RepID=UPI0008DD4B42|nr:NAD(P)-dependent alcohol dehydrogenase [Arthrobacter sp. UCD-GKA]OIH85278.1 NAD(P)-dependent alcohol dehydrogenase [Arthrobacter sp. UCD-GKA]